MQDQHQTITMTHIENYAQVS